MSNQYLIKYVLSVAIAISGNLGVTAQTRPDHGTTVEKAALGNLREQLASEWSEAVVTHNLEFPDEINQLQFSPDGRLLGVVGGSQTGIWHLGTGEIQRILPGHQAQKIDLEIAPTTIAFSPDSRYVATGTWSQGLLNPDWAILVRDVNTGEKVLELAKSDGCRQLLFAPEGEVIYAACGLGITAWSFPEGQKLFSFATKHPVEAIALSPDGQVMATVDANTSGQQEPTKQIQLWQLEANRGILQDTLAGHANEIKRLEFTADGKQLVSSSYDGKIKVWNWRQGTINRQTNNLYSHNGVFSLSSNSRIIAGSFHSETMINLKTGLPLINLRTIPADQPSNLIAFSPQEQLFARVKNHPQTGNSKIKLWQVGKSLINQAQASSRRHNYRKLPLKEYWSNRSDSAALAAENNQPSAIGQDLQAIALLGLGMTEIDDDDLEVAAKAKRDRLEIKQEFPQDNLALVTITQTKLSDDSVEGHRYLLEFVPYGEQQEQKWQLVWAGKQFRCWQGRGHQNWGTDLCH